MRSWRKAQRAGLVARRLGMTPEERERGSAAITARLAPLPLLERPVSSIGFDDARLETIHLQPHDVPIDLIVTERQTVRGIAAAQNGTVSVSCDPGHACGEERR